MAAASTCAASDGWKTSLTFGCEARNAATFAAEAERRACASPARVERRREWPRPGASRGCRRAWPSGPSRRWQTGSRWSRGSPTCRDRCRRATWCRWRRRCRRRSSSGGTLNAHGEAMVVSSTSRMPGALLAGAGHHRAQQVEVLRADQRVGEGLGEHESRRRRDGRRQRRRIAIVHHRDGATDARRQPLQVAAGLVVDLPHEHGVAARLP